MSVKTLRSNTFTTQQQTFVGAKRTYPYIYYGTVYQTTNRHIQAVMNNLKFVSYLIKFIRLLGCEEIWDFGLTQRQGRIKPGRLAGAISVIFGSHVS